MENTGTKSNEEIFKLVQNFLKNPPLIVWGSGATIPFGLPSMNDLYEKIKNTYSDFGSPNKNLEVELGDEKYLPIILNIKNIIWQSIDEADIKVLNQIIANNVSEFNGIKKLLEKFLDVHPQILNILTTNYDRVLEYVMSFNDISFTDGFNGKALSTFNENQFKKENIVNLIKVHGSLNWFNVEGEIRFLPQKIQSFTPQIIVPGKNKYKESYNSPYRELIQRADVAIKGTKSFLIVGFGFNDEHLTPRIRTQIKRGIPIISLSKKITENTLLEIRTAEKYILFEEFGNERTKVIFKKNNSEAENTVELDGAYWQLTKFVEII